MCTLTGPAENLEQNTESQTSFQEKEKHSKQDEEILNKLEIGINFENIKEFQRIDKLFTTKTETVIKDEIKKKLDKESEYFATLRSTSSIWVKKQEQHIRLRGHWSFCILSILCFQILVLLVIICTRENLDKSVGLFITGVFIEMLIIPKQISEHLFPKSEINHTNEILKLLISREKKE